MKAVLLTDEELATLKLPNDRSFPAVVIAVEGGIVQGFSANGHGIDVSVIDYDEDTHLVSQPDGETARGWMYGVHESYDPDWVNSEIILDTAHVE